MRTVYVQTVGSNTGGRTSSVSQQLFNELVKQRDISMEVTMGYLKPCQYITHWKKNMGLRDSPQ